MIAMNEYLSAAELAQLNILSLPNPSISHPNFIARGTVLNAYAQ